MASRRRRRKKEEESSSKDSSLISGEISSNPAPNSHPSESSIELDIDDDDSFDEDSSSVLAPGAQKAVNIPTERRELPSKRQLPQAKQTSTSPEATTEREQPDAAANKRALRKHPSIDPLRTQAEKNPNQHLSLRSQTPEIKTTSSSLPDDDDFELDDFDSEPPLSTEVKTDAPSTGEKKETSVLQKLREKEERLRGQTETTPPAAKKQTRQRPSGTPEFEKNTRSDRTPNPVSSTAETNPNRNTLPPNPKKESHSRSSLEEDSKKAAALSSQFKKSTETETEAKPSEPGNNTSIQQTIRNAKEETEPSFKSFKTLALAEKIALAAVLLLVTTGAIFGLSTLYRDTPQPEKEQKLKFPLEGANLSLSSLKTYWRRPIREGANQDTGISKKLEFLPVVEFELGEVKNAKSLRLFFQDEEGRFKGDATTLWLNGKKLQESKDANVTISGNKTTIHCTKGLIYKGSMVSYLCNPDLRWELVIRESANGSTYDDLIVTPISPVQISLKELGEQSK